MKIQRDSHTGEFWALCSLVSNLLLIFNPPRFVLNGLSNANEVLGGKVFDEKKWNVVGEYVYDERGGRHQAFYSPRKDTVVLGHLVRAHERIKIEQSLKYSAEESQRLWETSGLAEAAHWSKDHVYGTWRALLLHLAFRDSLWVSRRD